jgi:hypothetical protein
MSRDYEVELHITRRNCSRPLTEDEAADVLLQILDTSDGWMHSSYEEDEFDYQWCISGYLTLYGGMSPQQMHDKINRELPEYAIHSKWLNRSMERWDEEIYNR